MPKVSVIIPVYNVEKYLRACLDSVVNQTFRDIEIICVDDGSTDGSGAILDEYAAKDSRMRVIRQANAGAGAARNAGLDVATGEYVFFADRRTLAHLSKTGAVHRSWRFGCPSWTRLKRRFAIRMRFGAESRRRGESTSEWCRFRREARSSMPWTRRSMCCPGTPTRRITITGARARFFTCGHKKRATPREIALRQVGIASPAADVRIIPLRTLWFGS